jgi:hypothetical protein
MPTAIHQQLWRCVVAFNPTDPQGEVANPSITTMVQ